MNVKGMLTKKLGPLPAWAWGLVLGGGYIGYRMLSGKGVSLTGSDTPVQTTMPEEYADEYGGPSASYGTGGGVPSVTIINQLPEGGIADDDLAAQLAKSKEYGKRMKERGDNWAQWGKSWKDTAKGTPGLRAPLRKGSTKPKTKNTAKSRRRGTQGTQVLRRQATAAPQRALKKPVKKSG